MAVESVQLDMLTMEADGLRSEVLRERLTRFQNVAMESLQ